MFIPLLLYEHKPAHPSWEIQQASLRFSFKLAQHYQQNNSPGLAQINKPMLNARSSKIYTI